MPPGARRQVTNAAAEKSWFRVVNHADGGEPTILIYDSIGMWGIYAEDVIAELKAIAAPALTLKINSPGGSVYEALALYNALLDHPARVNVVVDGIAASAASIV